MIANPHTNSSSAKEYLELEQSSLIKHEYRDGLIYAIAGASNIHVLIAGNLFALLRGHIRGQGCRAYIADTKVNIEACDAYYYPDVVISCDSRDREFKNYLRYPCLIVEVLSDTTEAFDRGDKFADYRQLDTLQEYVLVSQTRKRVECFRRNDQGYWELYSYDESDQIYLQSLDFRCTTADLYEDADLPQATRP
jgi:Uma2 family endonuclease